MSVIFKFSLSLLSFFLSFLLSFFPGKVACIRIKIGRGVCGTTVKNGVTTVVEDVNKFPGHIACDSASNSEVVVPIFATNSEGKRVCVGVLDIDSPMVGGMTEEDKQGR
jgi:GAF domain-containing protein